MDSLSIIIKLNECTSASTCWCDPNLTYGKQLIATDVFFKMLNDWILFGMENKMENVIVKILDCCISFNDTRCINKDTFMKIYPNTLKPLGKNVTEIAKGTLDISDCLKDKAMHVLSVWLGILESATEEVSSAGSSTTPSTTTSTITRTSSKSTPVSILSSLVILIQLYAITRQEVNLNSLVNPDCLVRCMLEISEVCNICNSVKYV